MSGKEGREVKGRSRVILGSPKAVRSGPERGKRSEVTTYIFHCFLCVYMPVCVTCES